MPDSKDYKAPDEIHAVAANLLYACDGKSGPAQIEMVASALRAQRTQESTASQDARYAERYRKLRRGQHWSVIDGAGDTLRAEALDAAIDAVLAAPSAAGSEGAPKFDKTYCSQCGGEFGPGNAGYSHCSDHATEQNEFEAGRWIWVQQFVARLSSRVGIPRSDAERIANEMYVRTDPEKAADAEAEAWESQK